MLDILTVAHLKKRIEAMVEFIVSKNPRLVDRRLMAVVALGAMFLPLVAGVAGEPQADEQGASSSAFEVVSVKVHKGGEKQAYFESTRNRLAIRNLPVGDIIMRAYRAHQQQWSLAPRLTIPNDTYDIDAKPAHPVSRAEMMLMLQNLLADRFKLTLHRDIKEIAGYALVVDTNGPKMQEHPGEGGDCTRTAQSGEYRFENCTMELFVGRLLVGIVRDRIVIDKTGLDGSYDFKLFASWEAPANPREGKPEPQVINPGAPSIFNALTAQLGLKLRPQKISVEFFTIDHIEKPSEN